MKISINSFRSLLTFLIISMTYIPSQASSQAVDAFNVKSDRPHEITILNNGLAALEKRLELIERAKKSIDVEYFIYHPDTSGKLLTQALVKKAQEGVKVRILLDAFVVLKDFTPFYAMELERYGIEVKYYNKKGFPHISKAQYRNHRKLLAIDGKEAITGGRNIGDEYFDLSPDYNFLDRDIYVKGVIVKPIVETYNQLFNSKYSVRVERREMPRRMDYGVGRAGENIGRSLGQYKIDLKSWQDEVKQAEEFITTPVKNARLIRKNGKNNLSDEHAGVCDSLTFQSEYPTVGKKNTKPNRLLKYGIYDRIKNAKKSVYIESPYFILNSELGKALDVVLNKNEKVDVRLLTNSLNSTDAIYIYANFDSHIKTWINKGLEPFIFKGTRPDSYPIIESIAGKSKIGIHAKTFVFDNEDIIIGTYNLDPRSANYNTEMILSCENSRELAEVVANNIETRMEGGFHLNSEEDVNKLEFYETGFFKKIIYYLTKVPANVFSFLL